MCITVRFGFFLLLLTLIAACAEENNGTNGSVSNNSGGNPTGINNAPMASNLSILDTNGGDAEVGNRLFGSYFYSDMDGDNEGTSTFRWLRNGVAISGATELSYVLLTADAGQLISFEVTPVAVAGILSGSPVLSIGLQIEVHDPATPIIPFGLIKLFDGQSLAGLYTWLEATSYDDPTNVFTVANGLLRVSGDGIGGILTDDIYRDYHLIVEFKWGDETFGDRVNKAKDSGLLVHANGPDGSTLASNDQAGRWKSAFQSQVIEGGMGDFIIIQGNDENQNLIPQSVVIKTRFEVCENQSSWGCYYKPKAHTWGTDGSATIFTEWALIHHGRWDSAWGESLGFCLG